MVVEWNITPPTIFHGVKNTGGRVRGKRPNPWVGGGFQPAPEKVYGVPWVRVGLVGEEKPPRVAGDPGGPENGRVPVCEKIGHAPGARPDQTRKVLRRRHRGPVSLQGAPQTRNKFLVSEKRT